MLTRTLLLAAFVAITGPFAAAFAHDDNDTAVRHAREHAEHGREHQSVAVSHQAAHNDGFDSRAEHRTYHREVRKEHNEFHEDHASTRHGHDD